MFAFDSQLQLVLPRLPIRSELKHVPNDQENRNQVSNACGCQHQFGDHGWHPMHLLLIHCNHLRLRFTISSPHSHRWIFTPCAMSHTSVTSVGSTHDICGTQWHDEAAEKKKNKNYTTLTCPRHSTGLPYANQLTPSQPLPPGRATRQSDMAVPDGSCRRVFKSEGLDDLSVMLGPPLPRAEADLSKI